MTNWHQDSDRGGNRFNPRGRGSNNRFGKPAHGFHSSYHKDNNSEGGEQGEHKSSSSYGHSSSYGSNNHYGNSDRGNHFGGERHFAPRRPSADGEGSYDRPRRSFGNRAEGQEGRSYGSNRNFGGPRRSFGDEGHHISGDRFESHNEGEEGESSFRPRKRFGSEGGYRPDSRYSNKKQQEFIKDNVDPSKPMRLNRFLANAGICSRREADTYIQAGVVSINGNVVTELGTKVIPATDKVLFHDQLVRSEKKVYVLLNKPKDCVTTMDDPEARQTVMDLVKNACSERIYPVGRLDRNTTGLLLLTNDGDLSAKLMHPKYNNKKIYQVTLEHALSEADMQTIADGFELSDGPINADEICFPDPEDKKIVGIEIHSGRNRIVRRMFEHFGYKVMKLDRVLFAGLTKKNLPRGDWRYLTAKEVAQLQMGHF